MSKRKRSRSKKSEPRRPSKMAGAPLLFISRIMKDTKQKRKSSRTQKQKDQSPLHEPSVIYQPISIREPYSNQEELIQAKVIYTENTGKAMMQIAMLEEIWDVEWVQSIRVPWKLAWKEMEWQTKIDVHTIRYNDSKKIISIVGDLEVKALGITHESQKLEHETIRIPFSSTVRRPAALKEFYVTGNQPGSEITCPANRWVEGADWQVSMMADPLMCATEGLHEFSGQAAIRGRVWWYRKQIIPVMPPYIAKKGF